MVLIDGATHRYSKSFMDSLALGSYERFHYLHLSIDPAAKLTVCLVEPAHLHDYIAKCTGGLHIRAREVFEAYDFGFHARWVRLLCFLQGFNFRLLDLGF